MPLPLVVTLVVSFSLPAAARISAETAKFLAPPRDHTPGALTPFLADHPAWGALDSAGGVGADAESQPLLLAARRQQQNSADPIFLPRTRLAQRQRYNPSETGGGKVETADDINSDLPAGAGEEHKRKPGSVAGPVQTAAAPMVGRGMGGGPSWPAVGDEVEADWNGEGEWFDGRVAQAHADDTVWARQRP
jgi:hypothetical protein